MSGARSEKERGCCASDSRAPTAGGIYRAALTPGAPLETLAAVGDPVPDEPGAVFARFGEGLSMSSLGRHVAFWATWGTETRSLTLICPTEGNADLVAYCNEQYPEGLEVQIPIHQGVFVRDTVLGTTVRVAATGSDGIDDFLYWVFSGRPPGVGGGGEGESEDQEPPRWRSAAFVAVSGADGDAYSLAFKAHRGDVDGIYLRHGPAGLGAPLVAVIETGDLATEIDPEAPAGALVTALGVERDGFRDGRLAVNVSMLLEGETEEEGEGWAGVYLTFVAAPIPDGDGDGVADADDNCPYQANADQSDLGGIGADSEPDGIGDACQCGDVDGNGQVTLVDATVYLRSLLTPPTATIDRPELCNVGGSPACSIADVAILRRALLTPATATIAPVCDASRPH